MRGLHSRTVEADRPRHSPPQEPPNPARQPHPRTRHQLRPGRHGHRSSSPPPLPARHLPRRHRDDRGRREERYRPHLPIPPVPGKQVPGPGRNQCRRPPETVDPRRTRRRGHGPADRRRAPLRGGSAPRRADRPGRPPRSTNPNLTSPRSRRPRRRRRPVGLAAALPRCRRGCRINQPRPVPPPAREGTHRPHLPKPPNRPHRSPRSPPVPPSILDHPKPRPTPSQTHPRPVPAPDGTHRPHPPKPPNRPHRSPRSPPVPPSTAGGSRLRQMQPRGRRINQPRPPPAPGGTYRPHPPNRPKRPSAKPPPAATPRLRPIRPPARRMSRPARAAGPHVRLRRNRPLIRPGARSLPASRRPLETRERPARIGPHHPPRRPASPPGTTCPTRAPSISLRQRLPSGLPPSASALLASAAARPPQATDHHPTRRTRMSHRFLAFGSSSSNRPLSP